MDSPDDYILVREYKYTDSYGTIYVKFAEDASISGGANLILDKKAHLMVNSAVTVNVEDGGIVSYDMDVSNGEDESYIYVLNGGDLNFAEGSTLNINVDGDLEAYTDYYKYILYADNTSTLNNIYNDILRLYENGDVYLLNNGEELNGDWYFFEKGSVGTRLCMVPQKEVAHRNCNFSALPHYGSSFPIRPFRQFDACGF